MFAVPRHTAPTSDRRQDAGEKLGNISVIRAGSEGRLLGIRSAHCDSHDQRGVVFPGPGNLRLPGRASAAGGLADECIGAAASLERRLFDGRGSLFVVDADARPCESQRGPAIAAPGAHRGLGTGMRSRRRDTGDTPRARSRTRLLRSVTVTFRCRKAFAPRPPSFAAFQASSTETCSTGRCRWPGRSI